MWPVDVLLDSMGSSTLPSHGALLESSAPDWIWISFIIWLIYVLNDTYWAPILEKTLGSPLDSKEIKPVNPKGNQPWIFIGRTNTKVEAPRLWSPDEKSWLTGKDPDAGKDWKQEEKGKTEDGIVGWHHQFNGHEFEQTSGDGVG